VDLEREQGKKIWRGMAILPEASSRKGGLFHWEKNPAPSCERTKKGRGKGEGSQSAVLERRMMEKGKETA